MQVVATCTGATVWQRSLHLDRQYPVATRRWRTGTSSPSIIDPAAPTCSTGPRGIGSEAPRPAEMDYQVWDASTRRPCSGVRFPPAAWTVNLTWAPARENPHGWQRPSTGVRVESRGRPSGSKA